MSPSTKYILKLYVTNITPKTETSINNLRQACDREFGDEYDFQVINILENPQQAEDDRVLATPTLIKEQPAPKKRVIGDISNIEKVQIGLDLQGIT